MFHKILENGRTVAFKPHAKGELSIVVVIPAGMERQRMVSSVARVRRQNAME